MLLERGKLPLSKELHSHFTSMLKTMLNASLKVVTAVELCCQEGSNPVLIYFIKLKNEHPWNTRDLLFSRSQQKAA